MFLNSRDEFKNYLGKSKKPFMATFYKEVRRKSGILMGADGNPIGGKWSFDEDNRNKLPKDILIPKYQMLGAALATSMSYALMFLCLFYKNRNWMPINLVWRDIIFLGLISVVSVWSVIIASPWQYYIMIITILYIGVLLYKHGLKQLILLFNN